MRKLRNRLEELLLTVINVLQSIHEQILDTVDFHMFDAYIKRGSFLLDADPRRQFRTYKVALSIYTNLTEHPGVFKGGVS